MAVADSFGVSFRHLEAAVGSNGGLQYGRKAETFVFDFPLRRGTHLRLRHVRQPARNSHTLAGKNRRVLRRDERWSSRGRYCCDPYSRMGSIDTDRSRSGRLERGGNRFPSSDSQPVRTGVRDERLQRDVVGESYRHSRDRLTRVQPANLARKSISKTRLIRSGVSAGSVRTTASERTVICTVVAASGVRASIGPTSVATVASSPVRSATVPVNTDSVTRATPSSSASCRSY